MKKIGNRPFTKADTDFSKLQKMPNFFSYLLLELYFFLIPMSLGMI